MQRAGRHKVLGRGRSGLSPYSAPRARVLTGQRAGADVGRYISDPVVRTFVVLEACRDVGARVQ
jgi:hypothetical protein